MSRVENAWDVFIRGWHASDDHRLCHLHHFLLFLLNHFPWLLQIWLHLVKSLLIRAPPRLHLHVVVHGLRPFKSLICGVSARPHRLLTDGNLRLPTLVPLRDPWIHHTMELFRRFHLLLRVVGLIASFRCESNFRIKWRHGELKQLPIGLWW